MNFVYQEHNGLNLRSGIHCLIGAVVLYWICGLAVCEGVRGCHTLKRSELKMQQAWNPNSAGEGELGKMEMNSALMAIICRNTTWEVLVVSCFSFKLQRMWHRKGELLEDFCFRQSCELMRLPNTSVSEGNYNNRA
ncbi:unnamed protein product [Citrullus colocynthis]|uniref:Uncharacterized protein n=1 Tax=Citrullus colocynthis TaxID=252529 RepID=A0ABP0XSW6_9ROSI